MRPPASETENRTHSVKKIGPSQYFDFFNRIDPMQKWTVHRSMRRRPSARLVWSRDPGYDSDPVSTNGLRSDNRHFPDAAVA